MVSPATALGVQGQQGQQAPGPNDALRGLDLDEFLKLMITELQNQDPLNPMENSEILQQISQIREIEATGKLTSTLDAVLLGQTLTSASGLIGKHVKSVVEDAGATTEIEGTVERVTLTDNTPMLHVGRFSFPLTQIKEINVAE
jgi:flagellar basal-body rod modification protein FlgD